MLFLISLSNMFDNPTLQLCLFLCRQILHHHRLQAVGVDLNIPVEDLHYSHNGHDNDPQHDPADSFQHFGIRKDGYGNLL